MRILTFTFLFFLSGCAAVQGTGLIQPEQTLQAFDGRVWITDVSINGADSSSENTFILDLQTYATDLQFAKQVNLMPGKVKPGDYQMNLTFNEHTFKRHPHPAYFPAAILTATLYIWANGPIFNDIAQAQLDLELKDSEGNSLKTFNASINESKTVGFWDGEYHMPSFIEFRTKAINDVLTEANSYLLTTKGATSNEKSQ